VEDKFSIKMTAEQRLARVALDIYKNKDFAPLFGVASVGQVYIVDTKDKNGNEAGFPTAATDGVDEYYNREWVMNMTRKQLRAVRLHEVKHKFYKHTMLYKNLHAINPQACNAAMDLFININLDEMDPKHEFIEWPTDYPPLLDKKYSGWSVVQIFNDLMKQAKSQQQKSGGKDGKGKNESVPGGHGGFDQHQMHGDNGGQERTDEENAKLNQELDNAIRQGALLAGKMHDTKPINVDALQQVYRDWREPLRDFLVEVCAGDELETWDSIHRRSDAFPEVMPSTYDEQIGELVIACDTSGSMVSLYPLIFSHVAAIMKQVRPTKVHVIWWDTHVANHQEFLPDQYDDIGKLLAPKGGGGTSPQCVVTFMDKKKIKPVAVVWLTDGYVGSWPHGVKVPQVWGIAGHPGHGVPQPAQGKVIVIEEPGM
jgi:predicted metal-dependent peptidase